MGQNDKAQADLQAAVQIAQQKRDEDPWDWRNPLRLALYHLALGKAEQAERLYRQTLSGKVPAYRARTAAADLKDFLTLFPTHSQAWAIHGIVEEYLREAER
jgi:tetratricopeptide (TPR) repeat protein